MSFKHLFSPGRIGKMRLKNRLVMSPMVRNYADTKGSATPRYIAHIERIAKGGVGMMILEASFISKEARGFANQLGIQSDNVIPGLKKLAQAAHKHGAKIGVQLYHAGRQTVSATTGVQPVAPSAIPDPLEQEMPHKLSLKEIKSIVQAFGRSAKRAKKAGMDFVEIHGAHGYLITQFLSPFSNTRQDGYGGTFEKRMRFMREVFAAVRKAVGYDYPIVVRLSGDELLGSKGLRLEDVKHIAKELEKMGADALHVSAGVYASFVQGLMIQPMAIPDGVLVKLAAGIKKSVKIPVITVGKIRDPKMAEDILKGGKADFIAVGRMLLADPDYPNKVKAGKLKEVNGCIACNQGCISRLFAGQDVWCTVNAETSRELMFAKKPGAKKKVLVIGGGPAGLSAAKTAAKRGHKVTLYEGNKTLGGQLKAAGSLPFRSNWLDLMNTLTSDVKRLGVKVLLNTEFCPGIIEAGEFDAAIVATGSVAVRPQIPGVSGENVVMARDLIEGTAKAQGKVIVVGGGCMGSQVAEMLARKKHPVTIVEMMGSIAVDAPLDDGYLLLQRLKNLKVKTMLKTKVVSIGEKSVTVEQDGKQSELKTDTVVLCLGSKSVDGLAEELKGKVAKVSVVGDAIKARRVTDAVIEGALAALEI